MSEPKKPRPAKLVVSIIFREGEGGDASRLQSAVSRLEEKYGPADYRSLVLLFDYTGYYEREMGESLKRQLVSFKRLVEQGSLVEIKLHTGEMEKTLSDVEGLRTVNIDPGLLCPENFVLATGKNNAHRIYLGRGIFAEITLMYRDGKYRAMPWTYPDYASGEVQAILAEMRKLLMEQLRTCCMCGFNPDAVTKR